MSPIKTSLFAAAAALTATAAYAQLNPGLKVGNAPVVSSNDPFVRSLQDQVADLKKQVAALDAKLKTTTDTANGAKFVAGAVVSSVDKTANDLKALTNAYNRHQHYYNADIDTGQEKYVIASPTTEPKEFCTVGKVFPNSKMTKATCTPPPGK